MNNKFYNSLNMRQNINTQHLQQEEFLNENNDDSAVLSKS